MPQAAQSLPKIFRLLRKAANRVYLLPAQVSLIRTSPAVRSDGGRGRIRTSVARKERQIYSLLVLATHPPVRTGGINKEGHCASAKFEKTQRHLLRDAGTRFPQLFGILPLTQKLLWQSWRRDLNPRPSDYKSDALPTELRQHGANRRNITKGYVNCKGTLWKTCANFTHLRAGSNESSHPGLIFKSVLETISYTFDPCWGKKYLSRSWAMIAVHSPGKDR